MYDLERLTGGRQKSFDGVTSRSNAASDQAASRSRGAAAGKQGVVSRGVFETRGKPIGTARL
jgi:hypothetical protein